MLTKRLPASALAEILPLDVIAFGTLVVVVMNRLFDRMNWCYFHKSSPFEKVSECAVQGRSFYLIRSGLSWVCVKLRGSDRGLSLGFNGDGLDEGSSIERHKEARHGWYHIGTGGARLSGGGGD